MVFRSNRDVDMPKLPWGGGLTPGQEEPGNRNPHMQYAPARFKLAAENYKKEWIVADHPPKQAIRRSGRYLCSLKRGEGNAFLKPRGRVFWHRLTLELPNGETLNYLLT